MPGAAGGQEPMTGETREILTAGAAIALAAAAIVIVGHLVDLWMPIRLQVITVRFDQPLVVKIEK
jgi:hypothetical protein